MNTLLVLVTALVEVMSQNLNLRHLAGVGGGDAHDLATLNRANTSCFSGSVTLGVRARGR